MTPTEVMDQARVVLNDPGGSPRYTNAVLLPFFNDFLKSLASKRKELFHAIVDIDLVAGEYQSVSRAQTNGFVDILTNIDKEPITKITRTELEMQLPTWRSDMNTQKSINWCFLVPDNAFDFMLFPPAAVTDTVKAVVASIPDDILIGAIASPVANVPDNYRAPAVAYVAGRALAINTSSVDVEKGMSLIRSGLDSI